MLSRKVDWSVLAQCDSFAVQRYVESTDRRAMRCVEPMRDAQFARKLEKDPLWRDAYNTICCAYEKLKPDFSICYDNYGGYRLL